MKKIAIFSLLAIFLFNSVGYFIVFKVAQIEARKEIKTKIKLGLPDRELTSIEFPKSELSTIHWIKENKEFYFKGKLYDVVKKDEKSSSIVFYCIDDKQEHALFASLDKHVDTFISSQSSKRNSPSKKLNNHVIKIYFANSFDFNFFTNSTILFHSFSTKNHPSEFQETSSPPPEFV